ncbi:EF-hand, Ca insensitive [Kalmanozyma brasiliensis GHG001]|uniref:Actinin-like protein n=1 Tax=Kalmanozyma brasiliensis (strain GHG001) TaxID=1365824 RepID=V5GTN5_KALBG|nr:EF-hand, Ca insensitive [Kalmanozyma brasiliensis GHG001]EST09277.1 EF-hand, Ca insensitive [Kalmanozyma brasiliensis GHG001]
MAYKRSSVLVGLPDQDRGWEEVQAKTFTKWLNTKLESRQIPPMRSLASDLSDGVKLVQLMEIMGDTTLGRYYMNPRMRVQKAENVNLALEFIKSRGVVLTNVGAEDIVDGNLKLILGMIWTLILRFTIADISEEGVTAKEGLLLWCQRKTAPYQEVDVTNFTTSFKNGLALCALIHRHRPDLLNYDALPKDDPHACTRTAFQIAEEHLGIPQLLDVEDLCDRPKPDERSVMTYVAQYFHAFSSMEQAEVVSRRVATFADVMQGAWVMQQDYERRALHLIDTMTSLQNAWVAATFVGTYADARAQLTQFNEYKIGVKRELVRERTDLAALLGNIQTKLKTYHLPEWIPRHGLRQADLDAAWVTLALAEAHRSRSINAEIRKAKESLRIKFAEAANEFERQLREVAGGITTIEGDLKAQLEVVKQLLAQLDPIKERLSLITTLEQECTDAKVEENDHTIFTLSDLAFEWELVRASVSKKLAFIENQIVSRQHTNLTPAQLEEFESTFRYFDKDASNTLTVPELGAALASLGIIYTEDDIEQIHLQLCETFGAVSYDAFLTFLREITEDTTSPDQLLEAFQGLAGDKPYVTELDLRLALLPQGSIDYLKSAMPQVQVEGVEDAVYDYEGYLTGLFGVAQP